MNARAMVRTVQVAMVVLVVAVVGFATVQEAGATPNNGTNKPPSISTRVKNMTEACEDLGGSIDVSYSYDEDDNLVGANTSCTGGGYHGSNCTFTVDTTSCYTDPRRISPTTVSRGALPGTNAVAQDAGTPDVSRTPRSLGTAMLAGDEDE